MDIYFEEAKKIEEDAQIIMEWRNDSETRKMFYNQELKIWNLFWKEYKNEYFNETALTPCFAIFNTEKIGFLRSSHYEAPELLGKTFDIDINVSPKLRGKGLGSLIIEKFCDHIFSKNIDTVIAEVKIINRASARSFEKAGFLIHDEIVKQTKYGKYEILRFVKKKVPGIEQ